MAEDIHDWLTLLSAPGLGPSGFSALLGRFKTPRRVLAAPRHRLNEVPGIGSETARAVHQETDGEWARDQIASAAEAGIRILTLGDPDYPALLRQIYAPPPVLFVRGHIGICSEPTVAIVGSRSFTPYGRRTASQLAGQLVQRGITVVSGMALGIDAHAHRGALDRDGRTAAVLGSGLDHPYPRQNLGLFRRISETGAVITEFPFGTTPEPHNFPRRNRVISGLSLGVVVIEAGRRSGALLTAQHALEQNREVFAVPGPIHSGKSVGTNQLIKQGATLVQTADDVLEEIQGTLRLPPGGRFPSTAHPDAPEGALSGDELSVLHCLSPVDPLNVDAISGQTGLPSARVLSVLLSLELEDLVDQLPGKQFVRSGP